jgi:hypothetical protein
VMWIRRNPVHSRWNLQSQQDEMRWRVREFVD